MQLSLKALLLAAALAVAGADEIQAQRLRGLQTVGPAAVEPTTEFWAEEINAQIAVLREKLELPALAESPELTSSSLAAAREYSDIARLHSISRDNDLALERAKAEGFEGLVVKEYVAKVACGSKDKGACAKKVVEMWSHDPDIAFGAAYDPSMTELGTSVTATTQNKYVFVTHVGKPM